MVCEGCPLLDEAGQVPKLAELCYNVYVLGYLFTVDEGDDVRVGQITEDLDLGREVVLELLIELRGVDRLDGYDELPLSLQ